MLHHDYYVDVNIEQSDTQSRIILQIINYSSTTRAESILLFIP